VGAQEREDGWVEELMKRGFTETGEEGRKEV